MKTIQTLKQATMRVAALLAAIAAPSAFAASQTWSNAPQNALWAGSSNWIGNAVPGVLNNVVNNGVNGDTATFNAPLLGGIGGAGNPVIIDDATVANGKARMLGSIIFDTANCGRYAFFSPSAQQLNTVALPETGTLCLSHNGSVTLNAAVTNLQRFTLPVGIRVPSSTDGIYNLVNNAANSSATLYLTNVFHDGGTTRGVTFILNGSNTGTNTIEYLSQSPTVTTGISGVRKQGAGTWILSGANNLRATAPITIVEGTLIVQNAAVFSLANTATVTNTGVLQIEGVTLNQFALALHKGGTIRMNGTASINGVAVGAHAATSGNLSTTSASDVFTVGTLAAGNSLVAGGAADTVLNTSGLGTLVFAQANTYVGKWSFNAASNQINSPSALGTGANANVGAGAIFDLSLQGAVTFVPTTLGFGGSGTGSTIGTTAAAIVADAGAIVDLSTKNINLTFTPTGFGGDLTHPSLVVAQGTLAIGGNTFFINNAGGTALGFGTYRLITQTSGSITSGGGYAALIGGSGTVGGSTVSVVVTAGNVDLVVSPYVPKNLVWSGTGALWDIATTSDWLDGIPASVFNNSDNVTFNGTGLANPSVSLVGTLAPASVVVDTVSGDYTFTGVGQIAGTTSLVKKSAGILNLNTVNTYAGGTVVSNGTVKVGAGNAISAVGSGNVAVYGSGVIDLNGFNNTVNALLGNGTIDNASGGTSTLTIGGADHSGTFSGLVKNTSGTLGVTKLGTGSITLSGANTYVGPTVINAGTLEAQNANALGSGASAVAINSGNLRTTTSLNVTTLTGADGTTIANSAGAGASIITHSGVGNYTGIISDGASGNIGIYIPSGTLQLNGNNSYSGGTIVASGATLAIGVRNPGGSGTAGTGGITASNSAVIQLPTNVSTSSQVPNAITNVDATGTVYFRSSGQANSYNGQFIGGANNTNVYSGPMSIGGTVSWASFPGTVVVSNGASVRFNTGGAALESGGDNTVFIVEGNLFNRDTKIARLGALTGSGSLGNPSFANPGVSATFMIGAKNLSTAFSGPIGTSNSIVKVGTGSLTFNGIRYYTNTVTLPDTSVVAYTLFSNAVAYIGTTTVSNGTLTVVAPNNLTNSPSITLAGGTLDASTIGYFTNQTTPDISAIDQPTNTVVVTTGTLDILSGQSLNGTGNITGNVNVQPGSTVNAGLGIGTMAVSGSVSLNGTVNMDLNRSNLPQNCDRLNAASYSGGGATLNVANAGPTLLSGSTYQLFSSAVGAFTTVNLPTTSVDGSITYVWVNNIAVNGSITLTTGLNPAPAPITSVVSGSTLDLSWPTDRTGWTLQTQTNAINVGITATWFNVAGSTATNQMFMPIVPGNPTVFYRLTLPLP